MALIDSVDRRNTIAQPKPIEQPVQAQQAEKPVQAQQADKAVQADVQKAEIAPQAEIAKAKLQTDAFDAPVKGKPNLTGATLREQAVNNAETAALGKLTESQREQYLNTRDALANDPSAQSSLRSLLLNGKLTQTQANDGGNLLDQLDRLSSPNAKTIDGVDKNKLLSQVVKDVSRPFTIDQGKGNFFCGATAALTGLAYKNPAEYARIAADLGTEGKSSLAGYYQHDAADGSFKKDDQIVIEVKPENIGDDRRSVTQQLMAPALTEVGNGENYDVRADGTSIGKDGKAVKGTYADQVALMQQALTGEEVESAQLEHTDPTQPDSAVDPKLEEKKNFLKEQIAAGAQVAIKKEGHWFTVTNIQNDQATVLDNEGTSKTVALDDLLRHADAITYNAQVSKPQPSFAHDNGHGHDDHDHDDHHDETPGGGLRNGGGTIDPGD